MWKQDVPVTNTPHFSIAPSPSNSSSAGVCVHCMCVQSFGDSLLPIVLSFLLRAHSLSCGASCQGGRERKLSAKMKECGKIRNEGRELLKNWRNLICVFECVCWCSDPAVNSLLGAAYRQCTVQERVCHLNVWEYMILIFLPLKHAWQHFQRWNFTFLYHLFQIVPNFRHIILLCHSTVSNYFKYVLLLCW